VVIITGCGDGGQFFSVERWSSWTRDDAQANGTEFINSCTPSCAAGHFLKYRVFVRLWRPRICSNRKLEFTRLTARRLTKGAELTLVSPWSHPDRVSCP
jgi:hypothetical protein